MKLSTTVIYACLVALATARKPKSSKKSSAAIESSPLFMAEKVDTSRLIPYYIVLDSGIANAAHFIPLNPFKSDLINVETLPDHEDSSDVKYVLAAPSDVPVLGLATKDAKPTKLEHEPKITEPTDPTLSLARYRHEVSIMTRTSALAGSTQVRTDTSASQTPDGSYGVAAGQRATSEGVLVGSWTTRVVSLLFVATVAALTAL